ncbi:MAG: ABC-type branched-subunit amino acid transport system substrate-binding protein [Bradymonadia bacterium]|jgi:ABC-type branched-subunit amino acid transport system substrate-binding protein
MHYAFSTCLILALSVLVACSGQQPLPIASWEDLTETAPAPTTSDETAAASFDSAVAYYEAGRYEQALEAFQLFGAEFATDPMAVRAEIYAARTHIALGNVWEADTAFRSLRAAPDGPETHQAAILYLGFVEARRGNTETAIQGVADALTDGVVEIPVGWVVRGDEAQLGSLLAEAEISADLAEDSLNTLALVADFGEGLMLDYAIDRAAEVAEFHISPARRADLFENSSPFAQAALAAPLASQMGDTGDIVGALEILNRAAAATDQFARPERLDEVRATLELPGAELPLRYGAVLSLTGPTRRAGRAALGAMLLAQRTFEDRDAVSTLVIRDTYGTSDGAARAVAELADLGVSVIIGPVEDDLAAAAAEVAADNGLPIISLSPMAEQRRVDGVYRWLFDPRAEATTAVDVADGRGVSRYVIVSKPSDLSEPFFESFADAAEEHIERLGARVVRRVYLEAVEGDASATQRAAEAAAQAVASTDADAVILAVDDQLAATFSAYLTAQDIWPTAEGATRTADGRRAITYLGNSFMLTDSLLLNSSNYLSGAIIPYWFSPELAEGTAREFADRFYYTYGRDPGLLEAFAFDATLAARQILLNENLRAPVEVNSRLQGGVTVDGVIGAVEFDELGNPRVTPSVATIEDDLFVPLN